MDGTAQAIMKDHPDANWNEGKPWSEMDIGDLKQGLCIGKSIEEMADFLMRSVEEKATELGLLP